ncbi:MAG: ABC transporter substrate-binding protein [Syntrophales bacterium]|nr:ABC transporter substrate-binding protein [Syntrophales bacterium]
MKITRYLFVGLIAIVMSLALVVSSMATGPTEQIKTKVDRVMKILNDPALQNKKEKRRELITNVVEDMIDWQEVGRRTLAIHWKKRTPQEKEEFINLFRDLLKRTYSEKLDIYSGEQVVYENETIDGNRAVVKTKVVNRKKGTDAYVDYRMLKKGEQWLAYDVVIEGISAVNNYRVQFNEIISAASYDTLVRKMKNRELEKKEGSKKKSETDRE